LSNLLINVFSVQATTELDRRFGYIAPAKFERTAAEAYRSRRLGYENQILEMMAAGRPEYEILRQLVQSAQELMPQWRFNVFNLDPSGQRLHLAAAEGMPPEYEQAVEDMPLDPEAALEPEQRAESGSTQAELEVEEAEEIAEELPSLSQRLERVGRQFGLNLLGTPPLHDPSGRVRGVLGVYAPAEADLDEEHRRAVALIARLAGWVLGGSTARAEPEPLGTRLSSPSGVATFDRQLRFTYTNRAMLSISGYREGELIGWPISLLLGKAGAQSVRQGLSQTTEPPTLAQTALMTLKDGRRRRVLVSVLPREGEPLDGGGYLIVSDPQEHRRSVRMLQSAANIFESLGQSKAMDSDL
jgi:PAS domain S-box-containing protein